MAAIQFIHAIGALSVVLFAAIAPARAAEPLELRADFLWFVSGHGINLSHIVDGDDGAFAATKVVPLAEAPAAALAAQEKADGIRAAAALLQTPGEHIIPAGGGSAVNAYLIAARFLGKRGRIAAREIEFVVGVDLATGARRALVHAGADGELFDPDNGEAATAEFMPLYSVGPDRVRVHFKSDSQRHPEIDRTALVSFGSRKTDMVDLRNVFLPDLLARTMVSGP